MKPDLYAVLEIARTASQRQITSAYPRMALAYHPDRNVGPDAAERFKAVAEAYAVLFDAARRLAYDRWGHGAPRQSHPVPHPNGQQSDADTAFE
jgi:molecular chaperone DnaJ